MSFASPVRAAPARTFGAFLAEHVFARNLWGGAIVARVAFTRLEPAVERDLCDRAKKGDKAA